MGKIACFIGIAIDFNRSAYPFIQLVACFKDWDSYFFLIFLLKALEGYDYFGYYNHNLSTTSLFIG